MYTNRRTSPSSPLRRRAFAPAALLLAAGGAWLIPAAAGLADVVKVRTSNNPAAAPLPFKGRVDKIAKNGDVEELYWVSEQTGNVQHKPLDQVIEIDADNEPAFTAAEQAFAKGDLNAAADNYKKALSNSQQDWVKHRADIRLLGITGKTGDFAGAVQGFVELARKNPTAAQAHRPKLDDAKGDQLDSAISAVRSGSATASKESQQVLLPFLIDLYNAKKDTKGAQQALAELNKLAPAPTAQGTGTDSTPDTSAGTPTAAATAAKSAEADLALNEAQAALTGKQYDAVLKAINGHAGAFVDPEKQAKALYMLAEAKGGSATSPKALEDAALAYMRVVAHFKQQPGSPAADALFKTGSLEEKLQKRQEAISIYTQVVNEYKGSKAAGDAQAAIDRLKGGAAQ